VPVLEAARRSIAGAEGCGAFITCANRHIGKMKNKNVVTIKAFTIRKDLWQK
jgi:hypothetical protein